MNRTATKNKGALIIAIIVIVLVIMGNNPEKDSSVSYSSRKFSTYHSVINALEKGLNDADGEKIYQTVYTDDFMQALTENDINQLTKIIEFVHVVISDRLPLSLEIEDKTRLEDYQLSEIKSDYTLKSGSDIEITKGYTLTIELEESDYIYLDVFKIQGQGWKISRRSLNYFLGIEI